MRGAIILILTATVLVGCSAATSQCLQTPTSTKVQPQALQTCEEALKSDPDRQDVYHQYVGLLRVRERYDEIADWSRRVLDRDAKRVDALYNLAYALRKTGNCNEALKKYKAYAEVNSEDADPYYGMALCYEDLSNRGAAISAYEVYLKKEKRQGQDAWVSKARERIATLQGGTVLAAAPTPAAKPTPAAPTLIEPTLVSPPTPPAPVAKPPVAPAVKPPAPVAKPPVAPAVKPPAPAPVSTDCSAHEKAIAADPFATAAYDRFVECAARARRHADIIQRMRTAIRDNPDYTRGYLHLGQAYKATGDQVQAKAALAKACAAGVSEACGM